ncbi:MAG: class IV adenylate cyclase [Candidatus Methanoperedens sp.]|jgi:adenylate cyclase class 2|nr:class IV adenylate cyclase [Candidatus Methanoperedens sp.]PKL53553.1 MAG: class IV adenylate cyclase [Candidatus Methanoperedenaceae archaeon HGW-Methanoperedenaceae-1]
MIEIEVKVGLDDPKRVERSLIAFGATPTGIEEQADTYYNAPDRDFGKTDEALRIRGEDNEYYLTYKGPKLDKISKTRKEVEVSINDAYSMGEILSSLGFTPVRNVVKKRKKYRLGELVISLDEVRELGSFMEVEFMAKDSHANDEKLESIFKFIEKLGISRKSTIRESYLEMMLNNEK